MAFEIERKFKLADSSVIAGLVGQHLLQGYVSSGSAKVAIGHHNEDWHVRIEGLTTEDAPVTYLHPISPQDAQDLQVSPPDHPNPSD